MSRENHVMRRILLATLLMSSACTGRGEGRGNPACGIAALAAPNAVLEAFTVPQQTLSVPPARLPERFVVRLAAGPALPALVGRSDSGLVVGVEGSLPPQSAPAFGVLVVQRGGAPQGVVLFEGTPIEAAPRLGLVSVSGKTVPLFGVEVDMAGIQDASCPLFPDSIAR
jgi:hypothetical protein